MPFQNVPDIPAIPYIGSPNCGKLSLKFLATLPKLSWIEKTGSMVFFARN